MFIIAVDIGVGFTVVLTYQLRERSRLSHSDQLASRASIRRLIIANISRIFVLFSFRQDFARRFVSRIRSMFRSSSYVLITGNCQKRAAVLVKMFFATAARNLFRDGGPHAYLRAGTCASEKGSPKRGSSSSSPIHSICSISLPLLRDLVGLSFSFLRLLELSRSPFVSHVSTRSSYDGINSNRNGREVR